MCISGTLLKILHNFGFKLLAAAQLVNSRKTIFNSILWPTLLSCVCINLEPKQYDDNKSPYLER